VTSESCPRPDFFLHGNQIGYRGDFYIKAVCPFNRKFHLARVFGDENVDGFERIVRVREGPGFEISLLDVLFAK
jgi:hypothetical protein